MSISRIQHQGEPTSPWCTGWAQYWIERRESSHLLVLATRCRIVGVGGTRLALLDSGAQWSLIGGELAELARPHAEDMEWPLTMSTRLGRVEGRCHRLAIDLVADDGQDLRVSATVLLAPEWKGPAVVLGYRGLLERIRVGLDPGLHDGDQWFCFGATATAPLASGIP